MKGHRNDFSKWIGMMDFGPKKRGDGRNGNTYVIVECCRFAT